jgi:hypothetical protein
MSSHADRIRAVELYIQLGKRVKATSRQLGYPTRNALRNWYPNTSSIKTCVLVVLLAHRSFLRSRSRRRLNTTALTIGVSLRR